MKETDVELKTTPDMIDMYKKEEAKGQTNYNILHLASGSLGDSPGLYLQLALSRGYNILRVDIDKLSLEDRKLIQEITDMDLGLAGGTALNLFLKQEMSCKIEVGDIDCITVPPTSYNYVTTYHTRVKALGEPLKFYESKDYALLERHATAPLSVAKYEHGDVIIPHQESYVSYLDAVDLVLSQIVVVKSGMIGPDNTTDCTWFFVGNFKGIKADIRHKQVSLNHKAKLSPEQLVIREGRIQKYNERLTKLKWIR